MQAIIMAGGRGRRLRAVTGNSPKCLVEIGGRSILEIILTQLRAAGARRVILCLTRATTAIRDVFGDGRELGLDLHYSVADRYLGTVGQLALVEAFDTPSLVLNGDILTDLDFARLLHCHKRSAVIGTVVVHSHTLRLPFGEIICDRDGAITEYREKPEKHFLVSCGTYALDPSVKEFLPGGYVDMPDLIGGLIKGERILGTYRFEGRWHDIGTPDSLASAKSAFAAEPFAFLRIPERAPRRLTRALT